MIFDTDDMDTITTMLPDHSLTACLVAFRDHKFDVPMPTERLNGFTNLIHEPIEFCFRLAAKLDDVVIWDHCVGIDEGQSVFARLACCKYGAINIIEANPSWRINDDMIEKLLAHNDVSLFRRLLALPNPGKCSEDGWLFCAAAFAGPAEICTMIDAGAQGLHGVVENWEVVRAENCRDYARSIGLEKTLEFIKGLL
jgi:hypothetical protein